MPRSAKSAAASSPPDGNKHAPLDQKQLLGLIGYNCRRAYLCIFEVFKERMAAVDLRPVDYSVLVLVRANPEVNQKRLARALSIDPPNMATLLDRLEARKLVVRKRNPEDKRSQLLLLTPQGQKLCETAEAIVTKLEIDATSALTKDERAQLIRLAQKIFLR
jgi:DNA-binding MarR family transcriptional regulator